MHYHPACLIGSKFLSMQNTIEKISFLDIMTYLNPIQIFYLFLSKIRHNYWKGNLKCTHGHIILETSNIIIDNVSKIEEKSVSGLKLNRVDAFTIFCHYLFNGFFKNLLSIFHTFKYGGSGREPQQKYLFLYFNTEGRKELIAEILELYSNKPIN